TTLSPSAAPFPYTTLFRSDGATSLGESADGATSLGESADGTTKAGDIAGIVVNAAVSGFPEIEEATRTLDSEGARFVSPMFVPEIGRAHVCTPVTFRSRMP